ncbi:hypothetical protein OIU76_006365 [Salix suchowensis]|nr:hypothetical protein OIU76_006365 [Salix suchowensis]
MPLTILNTLLTGTYSAPMAKVLLTEQIWKAGILSKPEPEENLLRGAITNIMEALQRNVESKKLRYKDRILPQVFAMNTYWYIHMRARNTELGNLLGKLYLKMNNKAVAEESAYMYQRQAWKPLVRLLDKEESKRENESDSEDTRALIREKMESFLKGFGEVSQRHRSGSNTIHDVDLREQIKEATVKLVVPAYIEFLDAYSSALPSKSYVKPEAVLELLDQIFNGSDNKLKRRDSKHLTRVGPSFSFDGEIKDLRRLRSSTGDMWLFVGSRIPSCSV